MHPIIKCRDCREAIVNVAISTEQSLFLQLRNKGGLYHTSKDITTVAIFSEKNYKIPLKDSPCNIQ